VTDIPDEPYPPTPGGPEPPEVALRAARRLAQALANTIKAPTYVVEHAGTYLIQDDDDLAVYQDDDDLARIVASFQPQPPHAVTAQSIAIEAKLTTCGYCQGIHHIQQCPSLSRALRAESWVGADLGRGLCQMLWRNHAGFVELLLGATPARLVEYAESYIAFLRDYRPGSNVTVPEVLSIWAREMGRGPAMLERAA